MIQRGSCQFREQPPQPVEPPVATDPVSVRRRVEERLREAESQAAEIQASSPARSRGFWSDLAPLAIAILGITILGAVAVVKWRCG